MIRDTFFDLQRFAADTTLRSGTEGFSWESNAVGGASFVGTNSASDAADVGTANNAAYLVSNTAAGGQSTAGTATEVYLVGTSTDAGANRHFQIEDDSWEISLNDARDKVHVGTDGLDSIISGEVDLTVAGGRRNVFTETINGTPVYIQSDLGTNATISGNDANLTYTFNGTASNDTIGLDNNVTAVFNAAANNVEFKPSSDKTVDGVKDVSFARTVASTLPVATVTTDGTNIAVAVNDSSAVAVGNDTWQFANRRDTDVATITADATNGITAVAGYTTSATLNNSRGLESVTVNGTAWEEISGRLNANNSVIFNANGNATVNNTGAATVSGAEGANVQFATVTAAGVVANGASIEANVANLSVGLGATGEGIQGISHDTAFTATVAGDQSFAVSVGADTAYVVETTADKVEFRAGANDNATVTVEADKEYDVVGGDGRFEFSEAVAANGSNSVNINDADITLNNNGRTRNGNYVITSDKNKAGVDRITGLNANDAVSVGSDADGYTAVFNVVATTNVVTFTADGKTVSVNGSDVAGAQVTLTVDDNKNAVLVEGIDNNAIVTVSGGATYYFNDKKAGSMASVVTAENAHISIQNGIVDYRPESTQPGLTKDDEKWGEVATIGGSSLNGGVEDTVVSNRSTVYNDFYSLAGGNASAMSLAGYENDDDTAPSATKTAIQISGDTTLGEATHVTLTVGAGDSVGKAPLNIQRNENDSVVAVTVDLTASDKPSTVAIGTTGNNTVTASHEVSLSSGGDGYAYVGTRATGENKIFGGSGNDMLRHEGSKQATLVGGAGNDTIRGDENDIVRGGEGTDYFYDTAGYALDYNADEDIIIASRAKSFDEITAGNVRGSGNQIGFGDGKKLLTLSNIDPNSTVHVKVALLDNDGNLLDERKDIFLANGNGTVDASSVGEAGAIVFANEARNNVNGVHTVVGSEGKDSIYIGSNDFADGGKGNDLIVIDKDAINASVSLGAGTGQDTIKGWNFGFGNGKTVLDTGDAQVRARVYEDMLHISLQGSGEGSEDAILFEDTQQYESDKGHGQFDVLVGSKKYTAIRNNGDSKKGEDETSKGYAIATSNGEVADFYVAERNGKIIFTDGVTKSFTGDNAIRLGSDDDKQSYFAIRELDLGNNSKAQVIGTSERETVTVGGAANVGANKEISLAGGNDVIVSAGDDSLKAGHKFYFGKGDGRDTIENFSHYDGVDDDPDKQHTDTIILEGYTGLKVDNYSEGGGDRIEIGTTAEDRVVIYEADGVNVDKMYRIQVGFNAEAKIAKIGHSEGGNNFTYDKKVSYYVGASGDAHDTLTISNISENVEVWLDGQKGDFYRGIDVIDASAETYTNISIVGSADNNTITAGGEGTTNFLWGGAGDNSLIGGDGIDYFLYYKNSNASIAGANSSTGNHDTIEGYNAETDFIYLGDVTIDDIDISKMAANGEHAGISTEGVTVNFKNGGSLTVNVTDQEEVKFYMNDGAVYSAQRSTGAWQRDR